MRVICSSDSTDLRDRWALEAKFKLEHAEFKFGIVMPAAQRNLLVVLLHERMGVGVVRAIFRSFAASLGHVHDTGLIHGDFKVRTKPRIPTTTR